MKEQYELFRLKIAEYDCFLMASDDWVPALHFRELHLLPRVIFAMGAVTFVVGLIGRDLELTLFGAGIAFAGVAFNGIVVIFRIGYEPDGEQHPWLTKFLINP